MCSRDERELTGEIHFSCAPSVGSGLDLRGPTSPGRMRADGCFVDLDAPARPGGEEQFAVLDDRRINEQVIAPGDAVDVDLEHSEFGTTAQKWALTAEHKWP